MALIKPPDSFELPPDILLQVDKNKSIEIKDGILTFHCNPTMCYCPPAPINEYILHRAYISLFGKVVIKLNHPRMDYPQTVKIKEGSDNYDVAVKLMNILNQFCDCGIMESGHSSTPEQEARDNRIIAKQEQKKAEERAIKAEKRAMQQQADLMRQQQKLAKTLKKQLKSMPKCPRCGSTNLQYTTKKFNLGRAIIGNEIAGKTGAIIGGFSDNQGYAVCMNCGRKWKI